MYIPLTIKYRPRTLEDCIGQEVLVKVLQNALTSNKISNAFLFTGTRGVGKTTTARILALSLNCTSSEGPAVQPCLKCNNCQDIIHNRSLDVIEFDAASNTGVDSVRDITEKCTYKPINSRYKVFIIDEVHMLSKSAFNAFLKTLEEPPAFVKFIFATTELRKVPATILSRCQKFFLKNISEEKIMQHFKYVLEQENIIFQEGVLNILAYHAKGSMRDGLSLLDQACLMSDKNEITLEGVKEMLNIPDKQTVENLFKAIITQDIESVMNNINTIESCNYDIDSVFNDLLEIVTNIASFTIEFNNKIPVKSNYLVKYANIDEEFITTKLDISRILILWDVLLAELKNKALYNGVQFLKMTIFKALYSIAMPTVNELALLKEDELSVEVLKAFPGSKILGLN